MSAKHPHAKPPKRSLEERMRDALTAQSQTLMRHAWATRALPLAIISGLAPDERVRVVERLRVLRDEGFDGTDVKPTREIDELIAMIDKVAARFTAPEGAS